MDEISNSDEINNLETKRPFQIEGEAAKEMETKRPFQIEGEAAKEMETKRPFQIESEAAKEMETKRPFQIESKAETAYGGTKRPFQIESKAAKNIEMMRMEIAKEFTGQGMLVRNALITLIAQGHLLVEGVPGLGKTLLVRCIAKAIGGSCARVQFTPDLMPSDITGNIMLEGQTLQFITKKGPVFNNIFIADEINRAPAKTQAALFEAMQEYQVSLDGLSHPLPRPFMVLATENPFEHEGTYPLPDAQKDRFLLKVIADYPAFDEELAMVQRVVSKEGGGAELSVDMVRQVMSLEEFYCLQKLSTQIMVAPPIIDYAVRLVSASRNNAALQCGAGPRGSLALIRAARALALLEGRDFVIPDDIKSLAIPALSHRLTLSAESELEGLNADRIIEKIIAKTEAPRT
ncbi:MAG: MoxR family ATPase [Spirochaetaceae bacterium]|jgi:MoxR-like ATPase|nr:MoxR family ATPase [Spirochaetaceae bacterium]